MEIKRLKYPDDLKPYVNEVLLAETKEVDANTVLPFYADGYPGICYLRSKQGALLLPKNKVLSTFFLYGQTLEPIQISIEGSFQMIAFQLYPFAVRVLLGIEPRTLNDDCFDLSRMDDTVKKLSRIELVEKKISVISSFMDFLFEKSNNDPDSSIQLAISMIIKENGKITIKDLRERLFITERTFERRFVSQVGVTPKQFARIIQFQSSLNQITDEDYYRLTDVVYRHGYTDQSHFIRTFKGFTGMTPREFNIATS